MKHTLFRFLREEDGATIVEYAIMVGLIAAVCIGVITTIGQQVRDSLYERLKSAWT